MRFRVIVVVAGVLLAGCSDTKKAAMPAPVAAKVDNRIKESELTRITLSQESEQRLGIEVATATQVSSAGSLSVIGDVVAIPGRSLFVNAPATGTVSKFTAGLAVGTPVQAGQPLFTLTPIVAAQRDLKLSLQADLQSAKARLDNATVQRNRAKQLLSDMAGSQRNVDTADQEYSQANAAYQAAEQRMKRFENGPLDADVDIAVTAPSSGILRQIQAAPGQYVNGGAPLLEIADFSKVWLRVPVYAAQIKDLDSVQVILVRDADGAGTTRQARRVAAPPTADPLAATVDLYFELENSRSDLSPGQRMMAVLTTRTGVVRALSVPRSALLYDVQGGSWLYVAEGGRKYRRQRVELIGGSGANALISRGIDPSMRIVTAGAAELFGTEFGAGH